MYVKRPKEFLPAEFSVLKNKFRRAGSTHGGHNMLPLVGIWLMYMTKHCWEKSPCHSQCLNKELFSKWHRKLKTL